MNRQAFCISIYNKVYTEKAKNILGYLDKCPKILCYVS